MIGVILAGGDGTRFWPRSRHARPKQLIKIDPSSEQTMIEQTVDRVKALADQVYIITNVDHYVRTKELVGDRVSALVAEPVGRNTAAAVGLSALLITRQDPQAVLGIFPADHLITVGETYRQAMAAAVTAAAAGYLVTFGIKPRYPETGYGYLKFEPEPLPGLLCHRACEFCEKPELAVAKSYLEAGNYFWNSGMFVWRADVIIRELEAYQPELMRGLRAICAQVGPDLDLSASAELFAQLPSISIDHGVMEHSERVVVLPTDFSWNDVGSWGALDDISEQHDASGNITDGQTVMIDNKNCIVQGDGRLIAAIGLENIVIVDTPDALLVCHKDRVQDIKQALAELKQQGKTEYL